MYFKAYDKEIDVEIEIAVEEFTVMGNIHMFIAIQ